MIDNDWDRFYREFPDVYDRFAIASVSVIDLMDDVMGLQDKVVADVGSGTGRSTLEIAKRARVVVGVEPWVEMRSVSISKLKSSSADNVAFVNGVAESLPFRENSVDVIASVWAFPFWFFQTEGAAGRAESFLDDAEYALKDGGHLIFAGSAPRNYAGELTPEVLPDMLHISDTPPAAAKLFHEKGLTYFERDVVNHYSSVQEAVETYGFIYGQTAIDYLMSNDISTIGWKVGFWHKQV